MIKFFRRIRYDLIAKKLSTLEDAAQHSDVKVGRYLKYAIGEIVLVVIGILIALSINNWQQE